MAVKAISLERLCQCSLPLCSDHQSNEAKGSAGATKKCSFGFNWICSLCRCCNSVSRVVNTWPLYVFIMLYESVEKFQSLLHLTKLTFKGLSHTLPLPVMTWSCIGNLQVWLDGKITQLGNQRSPSHLSSKPYFSDKRKKGEQAEIAAAASYAFLTAKYFPCSPLEIDSV